MLLWKQYSVMQLERADVEKEEEVGMEGKQKETEKEGGSKKRKRRRRKKDQ